MTISTSQIENFLSKHGKTLKKGSEYESAAHEITVNYLDEMLEKKIQPYMEENLVALLGDVSKNK